MFEGMEACLSELAALEPGGLSDGELHDVVVAMELLAGRWRAQEARFLAVWDQRRVWAGDGSKSPAARLARDCGLSEMTARRELRRADRLDHLPLVAAGLASGELSV